jgi:CBS domain-containing protein
MDGGQALRSAIIVVTHRVALAALVVAVSGCLVGGLLATGAARSLINNDLFGAIWIGLIAFWIISGSLRQYWDLPDYQPQNWLTRLLWHWRPTPVGSVPPVSIPSDNVLVGQIMSRVEAVYSSATTINQFLQDSQARKLQDLEDAVVLQNGRLLGMVTRAIALAISPSQWELVQLSQIMAPANYFIALSVNDDLSLAIQAMSHYPDRPVTVFESNGEFAGLITRDDLKRYLHTTVIATNNASVNPQPRPTNPYL